MSQPSAAGSPEQQLDGFIAKFDAKNAKLIREIRAFLRRRFPTASELVYDNYNFFVIGYATSERPSDCIVSIAAQAKGVSLSFYHGSSLPDPHGILQGSGNQNRFIRLTGAADLERPEVEALLQAASEYPKTPLPATGKGKLIIRSVSEKQRSRRS
jgi:hypothetical protein